MNRVSSTYLGWSSFTVAVLGGLYAAKQWSLEREQVHVARGSKDLRPMSFEEKIMKAEWEERQAQLKKVGGEVHEIYMREQQAIANRTARLGKVDFSAEKA